MPRKLMCYHPSTPHKKRLLVCVFLCLLFLGFFSPLVALEQQEGVPLYWWQEGNFVNFGDHLSLKLLERIVGTPIRSAKKKGCEKKLLAVGSIFYFASDGDIIWGSGINGKRLDRKDYWFSNLDIRAVRGPLTRQFIMENFHIGCPEIYGDPVLLFPYFFPEFKKKEFPSYEYIIIPHYSEKALFPASKYKNVVFSTDPWNEILEKILNSKLVISTSLHGLIAAEAFGVPARMLRVTENEPLFKFIDYYLGTNRPHFQMAFSLEEAIKMQGEVPFQCDLKKLYEAFPFELWPSAHFKKPNFSTMGSE